MIDSMPSPVQSYAHHARIVPGFLAILLILLLTVIGSCVNLYQSWGDHERIYSASLVLVLSCCALGTALFARTFPLKAQDRAIRAEENLRHFVLTGRLLDARLTALQIVALRFASDHEFVELAKKSADQGTAPKDIKQAIKNWRADDYRV